MRLGARIFKTGISITLALYICSLFFPGGETLAAIAAALAVQPSLFQSWRYGLEQVQANFIGAILAIIVTFLIGNQPIIIALTVMIVIALNIQLKLEGTIAIAIVTVLAIMESTQTDFLLFAVNRFTLILIGILSSILVNALFIPPKYEDRLLRKVYSLRENINILFRFVLEEETEDRKTREDLSLMKNQLEEIRKLFSLFQEEKKYIGRRPYEEKRRMVVIRSMIETAEVGFQCLKTISSHSIALTRTEHPLMLQIKELLEQLSHYQEKIYLKFEGKIRAQHPHVKDEEVSLTSSQLIKSVFDREEGNASETLHHLVDILPVVAMIQEYHEYLDKLDRIIDSYLTYHHNAKNNK